VSSTETVANMAAIIYASRGAGASGGTRPAGDRSDFRTVAKDAWALFEAVEQEGVERIGSMKMGQP